MVAVAIVRMNRLFAVVMLSGVYSLIGALIFVVLDAVDVAFTEAAVGAGISTVLMLATLVITGRTEKKLNHNKILPLAVVCVTAAVLVWGTLDMPLFGNPGNPIHQHVADRYIEQSPIEIDIPNMVTSVLASYRGYDTMGEVVVVFTALMGVLSLLGIRNRRVDEIDIEHTENHEAANGFIKPSTNPNLSLKESDNRTRVGRPYPVLQVIVILIIPFIILFALYVQFHGDFGPGGGFQAGVIFATAIILYTLTHGLDDAMQLMPANLVLILSAIGVLIYGGTGVVSMLLGANFLDYDVLSSTPVAGQHLGILIIELGVGITVACAMMAIFFAFVGKAEKGMS